MKCDELKYERLCDAFNDYPDSTLVIRKQYVDEAIAELKFELENACLERDDNQTAIDELVEDNKTAMRALWMARAERAKTEMYAACGTGDIYLAWEKVKRLCMNKAEEYK